ncbi:alpha/beta fold hydrolase [Desulfovibrio sp. OttesenSCG-928-G11]|nr:alpha/beta fold hydrolase [Desulfovibrio sp. OttesenSCG-928-G11]
MSAAPACACLLLHGFAGTPFEMEPLAPGLEALGCSVDLPLLPGHGAGLAAFRKSFFPDWLHFAEQRFLTLCQSHDKVIPIGFSMGGCLALTIAARNSSRPQLAGVAALSPPHTILRFPPQSKKDLWLWLTPLLQYLRPEVPISQNPASLAAAPFQGLESPLCLPQLWSLIKGSGLMRRELPKLTRPLFLIYDLNDHVCPPENALRIARGCASTDVTLRWLRITERAGSRHRITTHRQSRDLAAAATAAFVRRLLNPTD